VGNFSALAVAPNSIDDANKTVAAVVSRFIVNVSI